MSQKSYCYKHDTYNARKMSKYVDTTQRQNPNQICRYMTWMLKKL